MVNKVLMSSPPLFRIHSLNYQRFAIRLLLLSMKLILAYNYEVIMKKIRIFYTFTILCTINVH